MAVVRIVGKAMNDLADEWHWVVLHNAEELGESLYFASTVDTVCGILIADQPRRVRLYDMGAPDEPTCVRCRDSGLSPDLAAQIDAIVEAAEATPLPSAP